MAKKVSIKVYRPDRTFLKFWDKAVFSGFSKELNAGLSECTIDLGLPFDYQGNELQEGNDVDILISDAQAQDLLIYSGYISMYSPWIKSGKEGITVNLLGHFTKLGIDILKSGTQTTLYTKTTVGLTTTLADLSVADIGVVLKVIIDRYKAETTNPKINYDANTILETSTNIEYTFELKTYREAIDKLLEMSPTGWWWYVDESGMFYFKSKPTTPTHTFIFGKHFSEIKVERSMEKSRNAMLFWNGELGASKIFKLYTKDASITQFGRRIEKYFDYAISDSATVDKIALKFLEESNQPEITVVCEILDNNENTINGYDIESIQPGDTCVFKGFNEQYSDIFKENMLITKVEYTLDKVVLTIEVQKAGIVEWQKQLDKKVEDSYSEGSPETYTT